MGTVLYWVCLPYATFGIVTKGDVVVRAAPIAKWARGRDIVVVLDYFRRKGAQIQSL